MTTSARPEGRAPHRRDHRRAKLFVTLAVGLVVALASAAFACTQFLGSAAITATGPLATGQASYQGDGGDDSSASKGYCSTPSRAAFTGGGTFRIDVQRASCNGAANLPTGLYAVSWIRSGQAADHTAEYWCGAFATENPDNPRVVLGTLDVKATGTSSGTYQLPAPGTGNVCVDPVGHNPGLSAPMMFVDWTVI